MKTRLFEKEDMYRKRICKHCGKEVFEKYLESQELDGGYTHVHDFEDSGYITVSANSPSGGYWGVLCPDCAKLYDRIIINWLESDVIQSKEN